MSPINGHRPFKSHKKDVRKGFLELRVAEVIPLGPRHIPAFQGARGALPEVA